MTDDPLRVLVTGAQGFVGRYLVRTLLATRKHIVVVGTGRSPREDARFTHRIDCRGQSVPAPLPAELLESAADDRYRYVAVDVEREQDISQFLEEFRPQWIIHLASALRDEAPDRLLRCNVQGTINLTSAIGRCGLTDARVVLGSSASVYGEAEPADLPISEAHPVRPVEMYGVSKVAAECAARALAQVYGIKLVTARIFNIVGPGQEERHVCARLVSQLAPAADEPGALTLRVGRLDTTRDFVDVRDAATAIVLLAERGVAGEAYNVASGIETSIRSVLDDCLALAGDASRVCVHATAGREGDVLRSVADIGRLRGLGHRPAHSMRDSLRDLFEYYRAISTLRSNSLDSATRDTASVQKQVGAVWQLACGTTVGQTVRKETSELHVDGGRPTGVEQ